MKCNFGRPSIQSFFGGDARDVRIIILLGEMRENNVARPRVEHFRICKKFADHCIRKMSGAAHHSLLDVPWIRTGLEHFEIVIRFENQAIGFAQVMLHKFGKIAEIRDDGDFHAVGAKRVADGIRGVMRNRERRNFNVADREDVARADLFHARQFFCGALRKSPANFAKRRFRQKRGRMPFVADLRKAAGMVGVLVRNQDAVEPFRLDVGRFHPAKEFFAVDAGVHQEAGALGFEQRGVARASGR